jgi:hypothetical protein
VACLRRLLGRGAKDARGEIGRIEGIAGRRGVDRLQDLRRRDLDPLAARFDQAAEWAALDDDLANAVRLEARDAGGRIGIAEQRLLILQGRQCDIDQRQDCVECASRGFRIAPAPRAVIAVKGDPAATTARGDQKRAQPRLTRLAIERQADAGEVEPVEARQPLQRRIVSAIEEFARRRAVPPIEETAFATASRSII